MVYLVFKYNTLYKIKLIAYFTTRKYACYSNYLNYLLIFIPPVGIENKKKLRYITEKNNRSKKINMEYQIDKCKSKSYIIMS